MRFLVDTSVWSLALRRGGPAEHPAVQLLMSCLDEDREIVLTGIILQEILQAFRDDITFARVADDLSAIELLDLDRDLFLEAATIHRVCASKGIAASTADCQIAAAAIRYRCALLTADKDFSHIARHAPLQLADWNQDGGTP